MHPFSLNTLNGTELESVAGGRPDIYTTLAIGEEGGEPPLPVDLAADLKEPDPTTLALGEEGGLPPVY